MADRLPADDAVVSFRPLLSAVQGRHIPSDPTQPLVWSSEHPRRHTSGWHAWESDLDNARDALLRRRLKQEE